MKKFHHDQLDLRLNNPGRLGANFMRNRSEYKGEKAQHKERNMEEQVSFSLFEAQNMRDIFSCGLA